METRILSGSMTVSPGPSRDVVVKLKTSEPGVRTVRTLAAGGPLETARPGPFERLVQSARLVQGAAVVSVEPLFPEGGARMAAATERLVLAVGNASNDELASLNVLHCTSPHEANAVAAELNSTDPNVEYAHVIQERFLQVVRKKGTLPPRGRPPGKTRTSRKRAAAPANDPLLNRQWGLRAIELFQAQQAAGFKEATAVVIAVIDTGVDAGHPDLQGVVFAEETFTTGPLKDVKGHGTHVTGIIAAVRNNGIGISGVCQSQRIMSLKALGPYGGPGYYRAIRHATDNGAQVMNFSLGGPHDPTEELLVRRALDRGIVVVAAMGNDYSHNAPIYPAAIPGVIAVGASTEIDRRATFSQTGPHISLVAPGTNILSTVPTYPTELAKTTDYDSWPGTSMATPFVTAAVALLLAKRPTATRARIIQALQAGADKVAGQQGFSEEYGHGRLNLRRSLAAI
jgi:hypothetical protein